MRILTTAHNALDRLATLPPIIKWRKKRFDSEFADKSFHSFRGVFDTFEAAAQSAPSSRPLGYDNPAAANMYEVRRFTIFTTDYPPLFWLATLFARQQITKVFDLGGHVGVSYYSYRKLLDYPTNLRWVVYDVPAVVKRGREIAAIEDQHQQLSFSESFAEATSFDLLFASGSLQYLPETLGAKLAKLSEKPRHILINMLPVHPVHGYFTLQSIGTAFCPYRIYGEPQLSSAMHEMGYRQVDRWVNPDKKCNIAFAPEHSLNHYLGFYFTKVDDF